MSDQLDPRVHNIQKIAGGAGIAVSGVLAAVAVVVFGASLITISIVGIIALFMVNYVVPVSARAIALWRQKTLTALAENFSESTILDDEKQEADRITQLESQYTTMRANLENAQEALRAQIPNATPDEQTMINNQLQAMADAITNAENVLKQRKEDFAELHRTNGVYITLNRAAAAMKASGQQVRDSDQLQAVQTARAAVKTRMRAALAGQTIAAMNMQLKNAHPDTSATPQITR